MKSKLIIAAIAFAIIAGCGKTTTDTSVTNERDSLIALINERDSSLNEFLAATSEIESNLDSIFLMEGAIRLSTSQESGINSTAKDRINANIAAINALMKQNREKINELSKKLKGANSKLAEYDRMIQHLNNRLAIKDQDINNLNDKLKALNLQVMELQTSVEILTAVNESQAQTISDQNKALHTAYYVVGESKDLRDKNIINKTGGLLGIGRTSQLDPNIDNSNFTQIDYTQVASIAINSKKAKIITSHPEDAYTLEKDNNTIINLHITNPDKFWSASKYLVIVKD